MYTDPGRPPWSSASKQDRVGQHPKAAREAVRAPRWTSLGGFRRNPRLISGAWQPVLDSGGRSQAWRQNVPGCKRRIENVMDLEILSPVADGPRGSRRPGGRAAGILTDELQVPLSRTLSRASALTTGLNEADVSSQAASLHETVVNLRLSRHHAGPTSVPALGDENAERPRRRGPNKRLRNFPFWSLWTLNRRSVSSPTATPQSRTQH